jgi:hypothetical protein
VTALRVEVIVEIEKARAAGIADRLRARVDRDRELLERIATPPAPTEEITFR